MFKLILLVSLFLSSGLTSAAGDKLVSFETDYCTGYPEGTLNEPKLWKHCCLEHDLYFWAGGNKEDRKVSDLLLKACVEETGEELQARLIYWAVSLGSYSPVKFSNKKWNYGWPERPVHQSLSNQDINKVEATLLKEDYKFIPAPVREKFLRQLRSR